MIKYKLNKGLISQEIDNKVLIFDVEKSTIYIFNDTASFIFKKIKRGLNEKKMIQEINKKFLVKESNIEKDLKKLLSNLRQKKIVSPIAEISKKPNK